MRWQDPARGLVAAGPLHPARRGHRADHADRRLGARGRRAARAREWDAAGLLPRVAFNASPPELRDPGYVERVADALARHGLDPGQMLIEVRESPIEDGGAHAQGHRASCTRSASSSRSTTSARSTRRCRGCASCPCRCSRSTARSCATCPATPRRRAIVRAIATLGAGLGMDVVAEGIETEAQLRVRRRGRLRLRPGLPLRAADAGRRGDAAALHRLGRGDAEQPERARDHALRRDARRQPERLQLLAARRLRTRQSR